MRLPRVRFTMRRMMAAVAILAAAFAAIAPWMKVDRDGWRQWRQHLNAEMTWVQSPVDEFYARDAEDPFKKFAANSLLKVSSPGVPDREGYYDRHRWWLGRGGELEEDRVTVTRVGGKGGGGQHVLDRGGAGPGPANHLGAPSSYRDLVARRPAPGRLPQ